MSNEKDIKNVKTQGVETKQEKQKKFSPSYTIKAIVQHAKKLKEAGLIDPVEYTYINDTMRNALMKDIGGEWF